MSARTRDNVAPWDALLALGAVLWGGAVAAAVWINAWALVAALAVAPSVIVGLYVVAAGSIDQHRARRADLTGRRLADLARANVAPTSREFTRFMRDANAADLAHTGRTLVAAARLDRP